MFFINESCREETKYYHCEQFVHIASTRYTRKYFRFDIHIKIQPFKQLFKKHIWMLHFPKTKLLIWYFCYLLHIVIKD